MDSHRLMIKVKELMHSSEIIASKINGIHVYIMFFIYYQILNRIKTMHITGDEPHYIIDAYAMAFNQNRNVLDIYKNSELVQSIYGSPNLAPHLLGDMTVTFHGVGMSILLVPVTLIMQHGFLFREYVALFAAGVPALSFVLLRKNSRFFNPSRLIVATFIVFGLPPFAFYTNQLYPEVPAIFLSLCALYFMQRKNLFGPIVAVIFANYLYWIHIRFIPLSIGIVLLILLKRNTFEKLISVVISILSFLVYLYFNFNWYGTFDIFFQRHYIQANLTPESHGSIFYRTFFGHLFSPSYGVIPWNPVLLLSLAGLLQIFKNLNKKDMHVTLVIFASCSLYLFAVAYGGAVGGLVFPARYMIVLMPCFYYGLVFFFHALSIRQKSFGRSMAGMGIFFIVLSLIYLPISYKNVDNLYGRGDFQNQSLVPIARDFASLWPDYSSNYGTMMFVVNPSADDGQKSDFSLDYMPMGTFAVKAIGDASTVQSIQINSNEFQVNSLDNSEESQHLIGTFLNRRFGYVGGAVIWKSDAREVIRLELNQLSPVKSEFPETRHTLLILFAILVLKRWNFQK